MLVSTKKTHNLQTILTFIVPSLIGLFLFMMPISFQGNITIPIAIVAKSLQSLLGASLPLIVTIIVVFTGLVTLLHKIFNFNLIKNSPFFNGLINVSPIWFVVRLLGAIFITFTFLSIGPEMIFSGGTGALVLNDLLPVLFCVFIFAGLLLPLLLNFGLLELFGTLLTKIMRPVFNISVSYVRRALNLLRASFSPIFQYFSAVNVTPVSFSPIFQYFLTCMHAVHSASAWRHEPWIRQPWKVPSTHRDFRAEEVLFIEL